VPVLAGAPPRRPSTDHSRAGTPTASILAGPAVSRRRSSPRPRSPHCCCCCAGAALPLLLFLGPSLARPRSLSRVHSLSLSLSFLARVSSLSLSLLSLLSQVFSPLVLALARTLFLSLSFLTRASPTRACFLGPSLARPRSLSRSRRSAGSAHFTCRAMSRAAYPVPPLRPLHRPSLRISSRPLRHVASTQCHRSAPSAGHRSAPRRVCRATSSRFPAPRGINAKGGMPSGEPCQRPDAKDTSCTLRPCCALARAEPPQLMPLSKCKSHILNDALMLHLTRRSPPWCASSHNCNAAPSPSRAHQAHLLRTSAAFTLSPHALHTQPLLPRFFLSTTFLPRRRAREAESVPRVRRTK